MAESIWGHAGKKENILDFKCGQLYRRGKMIHANEKKGRISVYHDENKILHIKWMTRPDMKAKPEDDLMILPGDCKFFHLDQCSDGRVFVLEFQSGKEKFFWLQEGNTDGDEEIFKKLGELVKNPHLKKEDLKKAQGSMMKGFQEKKKEKEEEKERTKSKLSEEAFNQQISGFLSGGPEGLLGDPNQVTVEFNDVLHSGRVQEILVNNPEICREVVGFLPEGAEATPEGIMKHIRSPQFRQASELVNMALKSGQVEGVTLGFDVPPNSRTAEKICREMAKKYDKMEDEK